MMLIYIVKHRISNLKYNSFENMVAYASSTLDKAKDFCLKNLNYEVKDPEVPWWFSYLLKKLTLMNLPRTIQLFIGMEKKYEYNYLLGWKRNMNSTFNWILGEKLCLLKMELDILT